MTFLLLYMYSFLFTPYYDPLVSFKSVEDVFALLIVGLSILHYKEQHSPALYMYAHM